MLYSPTPRLTAELLFPPMN
ncbi:hypothetical protein Gohar_003512 [Gossypium harknessii]|uniref:Uncharacterized protein n=1 Tax=Gossypium harknessii TaxID=34285 RepID=A0A7J9HRX5_9ROSI|nr:hypothetical protein [Gossypium harknessii]